MGRAEFFIAKFVALPCRPAIRRRAVGEEEVATGEELVSAVLAIGEAAAVDGDVGGVFAAEAGEAALEGGVGDESCCALHAREASIAAVDEAAV